VRLLVHLDAKWAKRRTGAVGEAGRGTNMNESIGTKEKKTKAVRKV
jgi:hypothetical protein